MGEEGLTKNVEVGVCTDGVSDGELWNIRERPLPRGYRFYGYSPKI